MVMDQHIYCTNDMIKILEYLDAVYPNNPFFYSTHSKCIHMHAFLRVFSLFYTENFLIDFNH